ncbi:late control protein D [Azospirillum cavernae]|uniref:Late control protein D n=1 Tax=Azospirillum cavernae TaxID=2320860 RepID=A0A418VVJ5_9PROT|nr:contractile injection system protein, VgrG/Pvc8 family [Azospirillum cavernae]RJF81139.1 late control protein D [Azospirillum cavernae]
MIPVFRLTADRKDITAAIADRLISISYKDEAETKSDRLTLRLDDRPRDGSYLAMPSVGTKLEFAIGYKDGGAVSMGSFTVDEIKYSGPVATLEIGAKAAGMETSFRSPVSKSWNDTTLGAIAEAIAKEHGFTVKADPVLAAVPVRHEDQTNESSMAFLTRLASAHDAVAKPVDGYLVLAPKGQAKAVTGKALPGVTLRPGDLTSWTYSYSARSEAGEADKDGADKPGSKGGTKAVYWDKDTAALNAVTVGDPPYENVKFVSSNPEKAAADASTKKNEKDREKARFNGSGPGNPRMMAEQRLTLSGFRPGVPTDWRVTSVEHKLDKGGYTCSLDAEQFNEGQQNAAANAAKLAKVGADGSVPDADVVRF